MATLVERVLIACPSADPPAHGSTSPSSSPSLRPSPLRTAKSLLRPVRSAGDGSPVPSETDSLAEHGFVRSTPSPAPATPVQQSPKSLTVRPPLPAKSRQRDSGIYEAAPPRIPDDARRARPSFGTTARSNSTSNATSFVESLSSRASSSILSPPHVEPRSSVYSDASSAEWGRCSMDSEGALHEGNAVTSAESPVEPTGAWSVPATAADHVPALRAAKEHSAGGLGIAGLVSVAQFDNDGDEVEEIRVRPHVDARSVSAPGLLSLRIEVPVRSLSTRSASSATTPGSERNGTSLYYSDADALGSEWPTDEGDSYKRSLLEFGESTWPDSSRETLGFVEQSAVIDRSGRNIEGVVVLPSRFSCALCLGGTDQYRHDASAAAADDIAPRSAALPRPRAPPRGTSRHPRHQPLRARRAARRARLVHQAARARHQWEPFLRAAVLPRHAPLAARPHRQRLCARVAPFARVATQAAYPVVAGEPHAIAPQLALSPRQARQAAG